MGWLQQDQVRDQHSQTQEREDAGQRQSERCVVSTGAGTHLVVATAMAWARPMRCACTRFIVLEFDWLLGCVHAWRAVR